MVYDVRKEDKERMSVVTAVTISHIRINDIVEHLYEVLDPKNNLRDPTVRIAFDALPEDSKKFLATSMFIYRYCIHRVLTLFKLYDTAHWQYHLADDYYSQDLLSITLKGDVAARVDSVLRHLSASPDNKKIEYVLKLEFNRVLPELLNKSWFIDTVAVDKLYFSNAKLYEKCLEENLDYLREYKLPRGLCVREPRGDKEFRVVDGYHRLAETQRSGKTYCLVIYCV